MTCATALRLRVPVEMGIGITHHVTVPFSQEVWDAVRKYAKAQGQRPETIIAEAMRAYMGMYQ